MPEVFSRSELRDETTNSQAVPSGSRTITMVNNLYSTAYFNIVYNKIPTGFFTKNPLSDPISCSFVVNGGGGQAGFIVEPQASGSVTWTVPFDINIGELTMSSPNPLIYSTLDPTSSGSINGIEAQFS